MTDTITFKQGTKKRHELQLPVIHFVAADDWIDKLGPDAFCAWLKFYSWCDRSKNRLDKENDVIPSSFNKIINKLGVSRQKFYKKILPALWNYGLIDIVEYDMSSSNGRKPMNIIVYDAPQNIVEKKFKPIEKIRDYEKEYTSVARTFAKTGGRKKDNISSSHTSQTNKRLDGIKIIPGVVPKSYQGGSKIIPNNVSKVFNDSNSFTNDSKINQTILEKIDKLDIPDIIKKTLKTYKKRLIDDSIDLNSIESHFKAHTNILSVYEYESALSFVLAKTEGKISSYKARMKNAVDKQIEFKERAIQSQKFLPHNFRKDISPSWLKDYKENNQYQTIEDDKEKFEKEKALVQKHLKNWKKN